MTKKFRDLVESLPREDQEEIGKKTERLREFMESEKKRESRAKTLSE